MSKLHLNLLIGLVFIVVALHFFAHTMRSVAALVSPVANTKPHAVKSSARKDVNSQLTSQTKRALHQIRALIKKAKSSATTTDHSPNDEGFIYIISENDKLEVENPALSEKERKTLAKQLIQDRQSHSKTTHQIAKLLGKKTEQKAMFILTAAEKASAENASTCPNLAACLKVQQHIQQNAQKRLDALLKHHQKSSSR